MEAENSEDEFVSDNETPKKPQPRPEPQYETKLASQNEHLIMREATLIALIKKSFRNRVIIFSNEKVQCTRLHALLTIYGFSAAECHGNMSQAERLQSVEDFQAGKVSFLIATDVVARGLDIPNVHCIINFSFPTEPKRYIHRIGRTARAGQHGVAITMCNEEERKDLKKLSRKLNQNVSTFSIQPKFVTHHFSLIKEKLDRVVRDVQNQVQSEKEMKETMRDLKKSENMIKYKSEIESRPQKQWFMGQGKKQSVKEESIQDLKNIKNKFEEHQKNEN